MFLISAISYEHVPGWWLAVVGGQHPPGKKGPTMEFLVLAIIVIVGLSLYFVMRARAAR
jgi:hypothetical protein